MMTNSLTQTNKPREIKAIAGKAICDGSPWLSSLWACRSCGMRTLFTKGLMFGSLAMLNLGWFLRVSSEIPGYEGYRTQAWSVLPVSALIELAAVTLFAANLAVPLIRRPAYLIQNQGVAA